MWHDPIFPKPTRGYVVWAGEKRYFVNDKYQLVDLLKLVLPADDFQCRTITDKDIDWDNPHPLRGRSDA